MRLAELLSTPVSANLIFFTMAGTVENFAAIKKVSINVRLFANMRCLPSVVPVLFTKMQTIKGTAYVCTHFLAH